jgi:hypothetical protein
VVNRSVLEEKTARLMRSPGVYASFRTYEETEQDVNVIF